MPGVIMPKYFPATNPPMGGCWDDEIRRAWSPTPLNDDKLITRRNHMLFGMMAQVLSVFVGIVLNRYRKSMASIMFHLMLLIAAAVGFYGALYLKYYVMLAHSGLTCGFAVIFFGYMLLEMFLVDETSSAIIWVLMHFMMVWQFVFVYISSRLWNYIRHKYKFPDRQPFAENSQSNEEDIEDVKNQSSEFKKHITDIPALSNDHQIKIPDIKVHSSDQGNGASNVSGNWDFAAKQDKNSSISVKDENLCCICLNRPRSVAMVPCGHKCVCSDVKCHGGMVGKRCPICREKVERTMRIFD